MSKSMTSDPLVAALSREMDRVAKNNENWLERLNAVTEMTRIFTNLEQYTSGSDIPIEIWRILKPLKLMVQDLRSQIVKEVCTLLTTIASVTREAMVPFLREILPVLVDVRGSGNKVCGTYCAECLDVIVSFTVVKGSTLRFFVDTLLESKNKLIRLSCITVLKRTLAHWSAMLDKTDVQQIEKGLYNALQDPSASCRSESYELFGAFQQKFPKRAALLMSTVDYKIQRRLEAMIVPSSSSTGDTTVRSSMISTTSRPPAPRSIDSVSVADETTNDAMTLSSTSGMNYTLGDRVCIPDKELFGFVRFIGEIDGVKGVWVGIELDDMFGKNDGSVKGRYYFRCKPKHGVFARPHQVFLTIQGTSDLEHKPLSRPDDLASVDGGDNGVAQPPSSSIEAELNLELSSLQLSPGSNELGSMEGSVSEPSALAHVLTKAHVAHRKYIDRLLHLIRAELEEHERFETYITTASSADAVQYLQQLQNSAQDKIVLSDSFIQHVIQVQQAARES